VKNIYALVAHTKEMYKKREVWTAHQAPYVYEDSDVAKYALLTYKDHLIKEGIPEGSIASMEVVELTLIPREGGF